MDISKLNSLVELYFKKTEEVEGKRPFLKWLKPDKRTYNWEDVTERIYKLTVKIKSLIKQGDRCLILSENRPYWLMTDIAIMNAGGISVPIFTTYSANDYEYILNGTKERLESISSTLQELKTINRETNERLFKFIELEKKIDDLDIENVNTVKVFQSTIEYLVNSILSIQNFSKIEFRYSELLTNLIEDLSNGIRPKIAINNLIVESSKL